MFKSQNLHLYIFGGTENAFGAFDAWPKSATLQFRNGIGMALVPLPAGLGVPKRRLERFDAWPRRCLATEMVHTCGDPRRRPACAKARQGSADICIIF